MQKNLPLSFIPYTIRTFWWYNKTQIGRTGARDGTKKNVQTEAKFKQNINHDLTGRTQTLRNTRVTFSRGIFVGQIAPLLKSVWRAFAPYCLAIHHVTVSCYCYGNLYSRLRLLLCRSRLDVSTHNCPSLKSGIKSALCEWIFYLS